MKTSVFLPKITDMIVIVLHILFSAVKSFMELFIVVKRFLIASVTQVGLNQAKPRSQFSIKAEFSNSTVPSEHYSNVTLIGGPAPALVYRLEFASPVAEVYELRSTCLVRELY